MRAHRLSLVSSQLLLLHFLPYRQCPIRFSGHASLIQSTLQSEISLTQIMPCRAQDQYHRHVAPPHLLKIAAQEQKTIVSQHTNLDIFTLQ